MHFEISRATQRYNRVTAAQRTSSLYAEEPTVGGKTLRRGSPPLKVSPDQMQHLDVRVRQLMAAGSVTVVAVQDDGKRETLFVKGPNLSIVSGSFPTAEEISAAVAKDAVQKITITEEVVLPAPESIDPAAVAMLLATEVLPPTSGPLPAPPVEPEHMFSVPSTPPPSLDTIPFSPAPAPVESHVSKKTKK